MIFCELDAEKEICSVHGYQLSKQLNDSFAEIIKKHSQLAHCSIWKKLMIIKNEWTKEA